MAGVDNYFEQGLALYEQGDYARAIELFTKALRLSLGDLAQILLYRGICYAYLGANEKAFADFNGSLQRNPYAADTYNERGCMYRMRGELDLAVRDFDAAIHIEDDHDAAYYNRGLSHEQLGNYQQANDDLTTAIQLNPTVATAYEARGRVRARLKEFEGAIEDFDRYLRMGGGRQYDNHSEIQSYILTLRLNRFLSRFLPDQLLRT